MQFNSIKIIGFKSFLEPTEINLSNGLTGIVGPNGCGKSNVVEAIRWVMGENSAKQMRGNEMNNVIFSGTDDRPSRNFAEVILKIDNSERKAPYPFKNVLDIEISRKLERDKGSVYRVNNKITRARDVQLIFADTGTGSRSSGMVSQGKISEIIETKPETRRTILEEAANITGLHNRKHEAELKLNSASENLERLSDIEITIEEQIKELKKQARHAARYRSVGERIRKAEILLFYHHFKILEEEEKQSEEQLKENNKILNEFNLKVARLENHKLKVSEVIPNLKEIDFDKSNQVQNLKIAQIKTEQEINSINDVKSSILNQIEQLNEVIKSEKDSIVDTDKTISSLNKEIELNKKNGFDYSSKIENAHLETNKLRKISETSSKQLSEINSKILMINSNKNKTKDEIEINKNRISKINNQLENLKIREDELILEKNLKLKNKVSQKIEAYQNDYKKNKISHNELHSSLNDMNNNKINIENEISNLKTEISTINNFLSDDEQNSLEKKIDLTQNLETPIAAVLNESLSAPITKKNDLEKDHFWRNDIDFKSKHFSSPLNSIPVAKKIKNSNTLSFALQGVGIVKNKEEAYRLQKDLLFGQVLTTEKGGIWRWDGYVQNTHAKNSFVKRLSLRKNLEKLNIKLKQNKNSFLELNKKINSQNSKIENLDNLINKQLKEIELNNEIFNRCEIDLSIVKSRLKSNKILLIELEKSKKEINSKLKSLELHSDDFNNLPSLQAEELKLRNSYETTKNEFEEALSNEKYLNSQEEYRKKNMDQMLLQIKDWEERKKNSLTRLQSTNEKLSSLNNQLNAVDKQPHELQEKIKIIETKLELALDEYKKSSDNLVLKENELREIEKKQKMEETNLIHYREEKVRAESQIESVHLKIKNLEERLNEKLELKIEDFQEMTELKNIKDLDLSSDHIEALQIKLNKLLNERENIGAVNLRAEIEIDESNKKLLEMKSECDDLNKAIEKLKKAITELNKEGRERLETSFNKVNNNFKYLFKKLFNGGNAELKLVGSEDPLMSGLEIYASPPGKKMQNLSLLSGGEQALTSISLIFSVFLCNPSPLCILDEVDAALDDTNVNLFCELLNELVEENKINFIIVTHHRLTMAKMNRLLGVTMQEKGISKILSVDLEKAVEIREAS